MGEEESSLGNSGLAQVGDLQTGFLFATPSLVSGMARVLDFFGQFDAYNTSQTPDIADSKAQYCDFRVVGQDLRDAVEGLYDQEPEVNRRRWTLAFSEIAHARRQERQFVLPI